MAHTMRTRPALSLALLCVCLFVSCRPANRASALDRLKPCHSDEGPSDAYCGTLSVWENRKAQTGRKINLKIVVLPALKQDSAADPLFFLAGGPGQGAASMADMLREPFYPIQVNHDIVLVDQRGTGKSNPLECKPPNGKDSDDLTEDPIPVMVERLRACLASYKDKADVRQYTTTIAMDDLDEVRNFLGYSKIDLYGGSYGSRAALVYARRHADQTRAVIIDGVAPTFMRLPLFMPRDGQRDLDLLFRDCERDVACNQRFPNLRDRFRQLLDRLAAHPERIHIRDPRTGLERDADARHLVIAGSVFNALYSPVTSALVPLLIDQAIKGDYTGFFAMGAVFDPTVQTIAEGMHFSVVCSEDAPRIQPGDVARETAGTFMGAELIEARLKPCDFWPRGEVDPSYFENTPSEIPALILSSELDPVTPPTWGAQIASRWKNSKHVVVPNNGHIAAFSGCVMKLMNQFLTAGSASGLDTTCVNRIERPPFFLSPSGPDPMAGAAK